MDVAQSETSRSNAFLVGLETRASVGKLSVEASLEELGLLADTAGFEVVGKESQRLRHPDPATYIGRGKVQQVREWLGELDAHAVLFDDELSPRHQRELEKVFGEDVRVLDRTALILDIFAQHARSREGGLQVSLAQYEYLLPRLTRQWTHLARQTGGGTARGGAAGVGLRGPGETQLETDRREIRRKIASLKREIEQVRAHRERYRAKRRRAGIPVVALVGYTNAGKSTILKRISGSSVYIADKLFATLDPLTRRVELPGGAEVLVTDTVGFIQKLPHSLIAAFRATLEEVAEASIHIHVVDASHPHARFHIQAVEQTLRVDLGIPDLPTLLVFNKTDRLNQKHEMQEFEELVSDYPNALMISALKNVGMDALLISIEQALSVGRLDIEVVFPYSAGSEIARFRGLADNVLETPHELYLEMSGTIDKKYAASFRSFEK